MRASACIGPDTWVDVSADVAWQPPANAGSSPITDYLVNAYPHGSTTPTVFDTGSTTTSFQAYGLTDGIAYTFTVQAVNALGPGVESAAWSLVGTWCRRPPAPRPATPCFAG